VYAVIRQEYLPGKFLSLHVLGPHRLLVIVLILPDVLKTSRRRGLKRDDIVLPAFFCRTVLGKRRRKSKPLGIFLGPGWTDEFLCCPLDELRDRSERFCERVLQVGEGEKRLPGANKP